jgi:hypothetical protein
MNHAESYFCSFPVEPNGIWISSEERRMFEGRGKNSGVRVGDHESGPCMAKIGRYHVFSNHSTENLIRWIVDTHTREIRVMADSSIKLKTIKENLTP